MFGKIVYISDSVAHIAIPEGVPVNMDLMNLHVVFEDGERKVAAAMAQKMPWTDVNFREAEEAATLASEVFGYENVATALVNSYAWDTTLEWINQSVTNYSTNTSYGNYSGTIYPTGSTESDQMNYICDLAGNVREWTTEEYSPITSTGNKKNNSTRNIHIIEPMTLCC